MVSKATPPITAIFAIVLKLLASPLIAADNPAAAPLPAPAAPTNLVTSLDNWVNDCAIVKSVLLNRSSIYGLALLSALTSSSPVILPSAAIARSEPTLVSIPIAIAFKRPGACSAIELNSSPRNTPDAKA